MMMNSFYAPLLLDIFRFVPLTIVLAYAAFSDYKTGMVSNKVFLYAVPGGLLTLLQPLLFGGETLFLLNLTVAVISCGLGLAAFFLGGCGGADAKAIMLLGLCAPLTPLWGLLWLPLPLPLVGLFVGGVASLVYVVFRRGGVPFYRREVRFLPFMFIGFIVGIIL